MLDALTQTTSHLHAMFMHHIVAYACVLIADTVPSRYVLLRRPIQSTCQWSSASPVDLPGKQTPLFILIQSYSLAPALIYCIRTTKIQLLLCAAVVEPIPLHDLSLPQ